MNAVIRRKLSMAARALDFAQANPSTDPSYTGVVTRLAERVGRADALAVQQVEGTGGEHAAMGQRGTVRQTLLQPKVRHLLRVAKLAMAGHPELAGSFVRPLSGCPNKVFIVAARSLLAAAEAQKELLVGLGLGSAFIDDFAKAIADFDSQTHGAHAGRNGHVGAVADLESVAADCAALVGILDGLNEDRFHTDPEMLAAWKSARNQVGSFRQKHEPEPEPAPVPAELLLSDRSAPGDEVKRR